MRHIYVQGGLGSLAPGGLFTIVSNSQVSPTVVTTLLPHGLKSLDKVNFASSNSNASLNGVRVVTVLTPTTFSVPVDCSTAGGTAGTFQPVIVATSVANPTQVTTGTDHGLRTGDTITVTGSNGTPNVDGAAQVVTVTGARTFTLPVDVTVAGTAGIYTKVTYYSDVLNRGASTSGGALVVKSTIGTATFTVTCNIEGSVDGATWFNIPYALVATPRTFVVTALAAITSSVSTTYLLQELAFWRYARLKCASCTNVQLDPTVAYIE